MVAPLKGQYFTDYSPINGEPICEIARSSAEDVEKLWTRLTQLRICGARSTALRSSILLKHRRPRGGKSGSFWPCRKLWITGKTDSETRAGRRSSLHRSLPLFRRLYPRRGRHVSEMTNVDKHRLSFQGSRWVVSVRSSPGISPLVDGRLETRACIRGREIAW